MRLLFFALRLFAIAIGPSVAFADATNKIALVIGNQSYNGDVAHLKNPARDANIIKSSLESIGFDVREILDADRGTMLREINEFSNRLGSLGPNAIGFVYYSGHGVSRPEYSSNYLIPVDVKTLYDVNFWYNSISLNDVIEEFRHHAPEAATFIVLDACRTELRTPWKALQAGFTVPENRGTFIAFATSPNTSASDLGDDGGPYATALAEELRRPNENQYEVFQHVKRRVYDATLHVQLPWESNGLINEVYLNGHEPAVQKAEPVNQDTAKKAVSPPQPSPPLPPLGGTAASFCGDLKALVNLSSQDFAALHSGAPQDNEWDASFNINGFQNCKVSQGDDTTYRCNYITNSSHSKNLADLRQLQSKVSRCVGPAWSQNSLGDATIGLGDRSSHSIIVGMNQLPPGFGTTKARDYVSLQIYMHKEAPAKGVETIVSPKMPTGYCDRLKDVIASAPQKFASIAGNKDAIGITSRIQLSGWQDCRIYDAEMNNPNGNKYFTCELPDLQQLDDGNRFLDAASQPIESCLGNEWTRETSPNRDGRSDIYFHSPTNGTSVELRLAKTRGVYRPNLDVNMVR